MHFTNIFVKSFNRPYYLERCIRSVVQHLRGDYQIVILDDGTPAIYLSRIQALFPSVKIFRSPDYSVKSKAIEKHFLQREVYTIKTIPIEFWRNSVQQVQDIFLLLEEDSWFTGPVDLTEVHSIFDDRNVVTMKLGWNGNESIVGAGARSISLSFEEIRHRLPIETLLVARPLIANSIKIRSILTKTGLMSPKFLVPYYGLYTVASAFFQKDYWLFIWEGAKKEVHEPHQLLRALDWKALRQTSRYGKSKTEKVKTSFITSSTSTHHSSFDMLRLNHHLNSLWMKGDLNPTENMPHDFSITYLSGLLERVADPHCTSQAWREWITKFKEEYASVGCVVD